MASFLVDLENTCQITNSIGLTTGVGSVPASGVIVGKIVDMIHADANCNVLVNGGPDANAFFVRVQGADMSSGNQVLSGNFTDPTSGLAVMPSQFLSGGRLCINSGTYYSGSPDGTFIDGAALFCSGGSLAGSFQRVNRYVRALIESGSANVQLAFVDFISQKLATGSGGGTTLLPASGGISV